VRCEVVGCWRTVRVADGCFFGFMRETVKGQRDKLTILFVEELI
jgi:hypothetical protein